MKTETSKRIPVPLAQRWHDARTRLLPVLVFGATLATIALLWNQHVAAPSMVGQAEPVVASVSSQKPGMLAELMVNRFQQVKAGDPVGKVVVADPQVLTSSIAVIQSEIDMLRATIKPIADQQRAAINYNQLRLDWMRQRAQLATAQVNLQAAQSEFRRISELFKDKIVAERIYEQAKAKQDGLQREVEELDKLVCEGEKNFQSMQISNTVEIAKVSEDPLRAAIAVQESKLRLTEAELAPILLKAPMDGTVSVIHYRSGEAVMAGQAIISIATLNPVRIVGYMRPPILEDPKKGMKVEIRTRGLRREVAQTEIEQVGTQLEPMPSTMTSPLKIASSDLGLPIDIKLPDKLKLRAGELVDVVLLKQ